MQPLLELIFVTKKLIWHAMFVELVLYRVCPGSKISKLDGLTGNPGKTQKEGQESQGGKELGGGPP